VGVDDPTGADDLLDVPKVPDAPPDGPSAGAVPRRRRSVRWIVTTVVVSVLLIGALGAWVVAGSYAVTVDGRTIDCDALITWGNGPTASAKDEAFHKACDHQKDKRRTTALLFAVGIATVACAVSTVPSRRLTQASVDPDVS